MKSKEQKFTREVKCLLMLRRCNINMLFKIRGRTPSQMGETVGGLKIHRQITNEVEERVNAVTVKLIQIIIF